MESASEVLARIEAAEQTVAQKAFDKDGSDLIDLVKSQQGGGWSQDALTPATIARLAIVLRRWGNGLRDDEKNPEPLFKPAGEVLQEAIQSWPNDTSLLIELGALFYATAEYQSAFDVFAKVIKKGLAEAITAAKVLRRIRFELGDRIVAAHDQQAQLLDQADQLYPDNVTLLNERGELYYDQFQYDRAAEIFHSVLDKSSLPPQERIRAFEGYARALSELGRYDEASEIFAQAFSASSSPSGNLLAQNGWLKFNLEQYDQAFSEFTRAYERSIETKCEEDQHQARLGLITSSYAAYAAKQTAGVDKAEDVINKWRGQGLQFAEIFNLLFECDTRLTVVNLYPAALRNNELMLSDRFKTQLRGKRRARALRARVEALKWLRRYDEAEYQYRVAQKEFPEDIELWKEMANIQYRRQRFQESHEYYSGAALQKHPAQDTNKFRTDLAKDEDAREWAIVALRRMRLLEEARKSVNEALAINGKNKGFLCEKAYIYFTQRKFDEAITLFDRALSLDENYSFAHQWRAASYRKKLEFDKAREAIEEAMKKVPGDAGIWEEKAWLAFDQNKLEEADECFATAIKLDPYILQRRFSRVEVLTRLNRNQDAERILLQLKDEFEGDLVVGEQLGWFYLRQHNLDLADMEFSRLEKKDCRDCRNVLAINGRGGYYLEQSEYVLAERAFSCALEKVDYEPQYYINHAWALVRQVKQPCEISESKRLKHKQLIAKARASCRKALDLDPFESKAYNCLGVIAFTAGSYTEAEHYFRKSIEFSPVDGGQLELGALYVQMGRYEDAKAELEKGIKLNENDAHGYIEMANLFLLQDNAKEAIRYCRNATAIEPDNEAARRALAIALMRAGQYEEAEKALRKAINQLPSARSWQLHLVLAQILVRFGDDKNKDGKQKDISFYTEALNHVTDALRLHASPNADVLFHAGIANYKLSDFKASLKSFNECWQIDRERYEAERYRNSVQAIIEQERKNLSVPRIGGFALAGLSLLGLLLLWIAFAAGSQRTIPPVEGQAAAIESRIKTAIEKADASKEAAATADEANKAKVTADSEVSKILDQVAKATTTLDKDSLSKTVVAKLAEAKKSGEAATKAEIAKQTAAQNASEAFKTAAKPQQEVLVDRQMLTVYTPMLFGLFVIGLLLPNLSKLKLFGGIEAEITEVKTEISTGPRGDVGFGSSMTIISPGPH